MKNLPPELKAYKEEFDFLHKKIGDLEWKRATIFLGRKAIMRSESEVIEEQLENYRANMCILLTKVRDEVSRINSSKRK